MKNNAQIDLLLQFIDLCILLGCDYCDSIRGIGPKRAIDLIKQHKNIEEILKHLDSKVSVFVRDVSKYIAWVWMKSISFSSQMVRCKAAKSDMP